MAYGDVFLAISCTQIIVNLEKINSYAEYDFESLSETLKNQCI